MTRARACSRWIRPASAVTRHPRRRPWSRAADDDVAVLIFTSGTTGDARAAELTHGGIAWNARALADAFALTADDVQLAAAPLSHVLGMTGVMNASLMTGGAVALDGAVRGVRRVLVARVRGDHGRGGGAADVRRSAARGAQGRGCAAVTFRDGGRRRARDGGGARRGRDVSVRAARRLRYERGRRWNRGRVGDEPAKAAVGRARVSGERDQNRRSRDARAAAHR